MTQLLTMTTTHKFPLQDYDINTRLAALQRKKEYMISKGDHVDDLVSSIRDKVGSARDVLAGIQHPGVTFTRGSSLEVQTPNAIADQGWKSLT